MKLKRRSGFLWAASITTVSALAIGCGGDNECEQIYEMEAKCRGEKGDKDRFMKACSAAKSKEPDEFNEAAKCAKAGSCEAMQACKDAAIGKRRAKSVTKAIAEGKWKDAWDDCTLGAEYYGDATFKTECLKVLAEAPSKLQGEDLQRAGYRCSGEMGAELGKAVPEFAKACSTMNAGKLTSATEAVTKARDTGTNDFKACFELKDAAKQAGGEEVAKAETLCKEAELAEGVKKGLAEVAANIAAKKTRLPFECRSTLEELVKLDTEWAKGKRAELMKACFVDLGAMIVEVEGKDAKYVCPYAIKQVQEGVTKYELAAAHPEVAEMTKKLPAKCK